MNILKSVSQYLTKLLVPITYTEAQAYIEHCTRETCDSLEIVYSENIISKPMRDLLTDIYHNYPKKSIDHNIRYVIRTHMADRILDYKDTTYQGYGTLVRLVAKTKSYKREGLMTALNDIMEERTDRIA